MKALATTNDQDLNRALVEGRGEITFNNIFINLNENKRNARYYVRSAAGHDLWMSTHERGYAQQTCDMLLGKGKYLVRDNRI